MRDDSALLRDMLAACARIEAIVSEADRETFLTDAVSSAAVLHHLTVIGEAAGRLSSALRERHPRVPWRQIVSTRNRVVHGYFDLDWEILWVSATDDIPDLHTWLGEILKAEFPEQGP